VEVALSTASLISDAVVTRTTVAASGGVRWVGPVISVTSAFRRTASKAIS
jgi:hypothetical protein